MTASGGLVKPLRHATPNLLEGIDLSDGTLIASRNADGAAALVGHRVLVRGAGLGLEDGHALSVLQVPLVVEPGRPGVRAVTVRTASGREVTLRRDPADL